MSASSFKQSMALLPSSSVGLELLLKNVNVIKVVDDSSPPIAELNDGIPAISNYNKFYKYLEKKPYFSKISNKKIKENFFYKLDNKTYLRFWKILSKI